jgi:hypothetical protein
MVAIYPACLPGLCHTHSFLKVIYVLLFLTMAGMAVNPKYRLRPEELRRLAPIAEKATHPESRILLYTELEPRDAHLFQIIWYADRQCELLDDMEEVLARLDRNPACAAITDKEVFRTSIAGNPARIKILGETERFICWKKISHEEGKSYFERENEGRSESSPADSQY